MMKFHVTHSLAAILVKETMPRKEASPVCIHQYSYSPIIMSKENSWTGRDVLSDRHARECSQLC